MLLSSGPQTGDTCQSIAAANSLSFDQFIAINGLDMPCTKLPAPGGKVCLSGSCPLYTVQANDTCVGIYQANNISWSQLLAWNPYAFRSTPMKCASLILRMDTGS